MGSLCATLDENACTMSTTGSGSSKKSHQQQNTDTDQLRRLLPGMNANNSKVEVMEAAAKYIETLQTNLVGQIRTHGYADKLKSYSSSTNRADDFDSIRRAVDNYASSTMK